MKPVSVSELKAHLSRYLREVRRGGEVQVLDRGVPVARLVGLVDLPEGSAEDARRRLVASGTLRPGTGDTLAVLDTEPLTLSSSIGRALDDDRTDRA